MGYVATCLTNLKNTDPDLLFNYKTQKIVRINDRRLGLLYYAFVLAIVGYVIGYTIVYGKRYLLLEDPIGSVRMSLQKAPVVNASSLNYCLQNQPSINSFKNYNCAYFDAVNVVFPSAEQTALLASTRISSQQNTLNCNPLTDPQCSYTPVSNSSTVYVGDIEHFTLLLDHTAYATNLELQYNAQFLSGKLLDLDGNTMTLSAPNVVGVNKKLDILELQTLLTAAGVDSLDVDGEYINTKSNGSTSMRYSGIVLLVMIDYDNTHSFDVEDVQYTIRVRRIKYTEFKTTQYITIDSTNITQVDHHGIRILIQQGGSIGKFDFQTLLINAVSGFGLLAIVTILVDTLAVMVMPERSIYASYKYDDTLDFSDIRDGITSVNDDQLLSIKTRPSLAKGSSTHALLPKTETNNIYGESDALLGG